MTYVDPESNIVGGNYLRTQLDFYFPLEIFNTYVAPWMRQPVPHLRAMQLLESVPLDSVTFLSPGIDQVFRPSWTLSALTYLAVVVSYSYDSSLRQCPSLPSGHLSLQTNLQL